MNYGLLIREPIETDYIFGGSTQIVDSINLADSNWFPYYSDGEPQRKFVDVMACVTFSALNNLEAIFNYQLARGLISQENVLWLKDNGYIENGKLNFSDRFTAYKSGTTKDGNYAYKVGDSIRKDGLVPESKWAFTNGMDWNEYYKEIPQELTDLGLEFLKRFSIQYEQVKITRELLLEGTTVPNAEVIIEALKKAPLQVFVYAWEAPKDGVYQRTDKQFNHAISLGSPRWKIRDTYLDFDGDFNKLLATNFKFYDYAFKYNVTDKTMTNVKVLKDENSKTCGVLLPFDSEETMVNIMKLFGVSISEPIDWDKTLQGSYKLK